MAQQLKTHSDFKVGWITAIQPEYVAACALLDEEYEPLPSASPQDNNAYTFGRMGKHDVVIATLPKGRYGLASAACVAKDMRRSFPALRIGLVVGIGGGAPTPQHPIRLGDVVVGVPSDLHGGVIHYAFGRIIQERGFQRTGSLNSSPLFLLAAVQQLSAIHERRGHQIKNTIDSMVTRWSKLKDYRSPPRQTDILYASHSVHVGSSDTCLGVCSSNSADIVQREPRRDDEDDPAIHYGLIASADQLMKDALIRDTLAHSEDVLCFEMEASGLINDFPCLVIRGICDYADTHKSKTWRPYAAATAASYAKELLQIIPTQQIDRSPTNASSAPATAPGTNTITFNNGALMIGNREILQIGSQNFHGNVSYYNQHGDDRLTHD